MINSWFWWVTKIHGRDVMHEHHNRLHPTHVVSHAPRERHEDGREDVGLCDLYTARPQE